MRKCRFCAEEIQDAAIVCKHCGRDLIPGRVTGAAAAAPVTAAPSIDPSAARRSRHMAALAVGILALLGLVTFFNRSTMSDTAAITPKKTLNVSVKVGAMALEITNAGSEQAAGREMVVYINGSPPFTYKAIVEVPPLGKSVWIPLMTFTQKDGTRFNPIATAVTVVWIGGGGYDYRSFGKS